MIYLDYNATTPHHPDVIAAMRPYLEERFGNPSSGHAFGATARAAVERAREQVAALLNCRSGEVFFTSGGTESNNWAIRGLAHRGRHIVTTEVEHPAVTQVCRALERQGWEVTWLPVDAQGLVRVADVEAALRPDTALITVMHANNEVGTVQPVEAIGQLARARGVPFHTDAAQSIGKIPTDVEALAADLLTVAGHKLYAPKGIGALYVRSGVKLEPLMYGAGQEHGRRPGTENVLEIVGLGQACELARWPADLQGTCQRLYSALRGLENVRFNGHPSRRLPNTLSVSFAGVEAQALLGRLAGQVAASAGAACHSGAVEISPVLRAMRVPEEYARGTLRFSTGRFTTPEEIDTAAELILAAVARLRAT